jgi:Mannosyl-glycoprotein endo-beta-N-acetylglucosaminidase/LysM domain
MIDSRRISSLKFRFLLIVAFAYHLAGFGAKPAKTTRQEYINTYSKVAIQEMIHYHIPASITMAQACLESGNGNSTLAVDANNHFGIKCKGNWTGPTIRHDDDAPGECFRKYRNASDSYRDHSEFLTGGLRYQFLFDYNIKDYKKWAYGLKKAGYATDPQYPERLLKIIEEFQLYKLDDHSVGSDGNVENASANRSRSLFSRIFKRRPNDQSSNPYLLREVAKRNGAKAFFSKDGDTYEQLAAEFSIKPRALYRYNDVNPGERLEKGSIVYLQRKRASAPRGNTIHSMQVGESLWTVAQWYGIRLDALCRKNRMTRGEILVPGQQISLRYKVSKD